MKYLIVGLGNIGKEYENTRHNIGFKILDALAEASDVFFTQGRLAYFATLKLKGRELTLIKPTTYMNLSGRAVNYWLKQKKIPFERLLIVVDDVNLPLGKIRIRARGSDGGHNGIKDICSWLGTCNFPRLRFGIDKNYAPGGQADYVLGQWTDEEWKIVQERIPIAVEAIKSFVLNGIARTMSEYNSK